MNVDKPHKVISIWIIVFVVWCIIVFVGHDYLIQFDVATKLVFWSGLFWMAASPLVAMWFLNEIQKEESLSSKQCREVIK